ncbi:hypothetical protein M9435_006353 [Picochlorum sp. BPE23]|nr:hypothetical protein M9435_006353 [Picochlorum sp. BPE23]
MPGLTSIHEEECVKKIMKWVESSGGRVVYYNSQELLPDTAGISGSKHPSYTHVVTETVGSMDTIAPDTPHVNLVYLFACLQHHSVLGHHCYAPLPSTRPENRGFSKKKKTKEGYTGSFSGFVGRERILVEMMMQSLGMRTFRTLSISGPEKADVLIASDTEEESHKILAAMGVGIPVVNFQWLCDSFQEWVYLPLDGDGYRGRAGVDCIVREDAPGVEDPVCIPDSIDEAYSSTPSHAPTEDDGFQQLGTVVEDNEEGEDDEEEEEDQAGGEDHHVGANREEDQKEDDNNNDTIGEERGKETSEPSSPSTVMEAAPHVMEEVPKQRAPLKRKISSETVENKSKKNKIKDDDDDEKKKKKKKKKGGKKSNEQKNHHPPAHITLSGMHTHEQKQCAAILRASSFRYTIGTHDWDPAFTHVITPSMRRNQKCLCALASGAWILSPEYLRAADRTINEEDYEILDGNPSNGIEDNICRFWRQSPQRPFQGLVCGLYRIPPSSTPSRKDIRAILQAGGATLCAKSNLQSLNECDLIISTDESIAESMDTVALTPASLVTWLVSPSTPLPIDATKATEALTHMLEYRSSTQQVYSERVYAPKLNVCACLSWTSISGCRLKTQGLHPPPFGEITIRC